MAHYLIDNDKEDVDELRQYDFSKKESVLLKESEHWMSIVTMGENLKGDDRFSHYMSDHGNISVSYDNRIELERAILCQ